MPILTEKPRAAASPALLAADDYVCTHVPGSEGERLWCRRAEDVLCKVDAGEMTCEEALRQPVFAGELPEALRSVFGERLPRRVRPAGEGCVMTAAEDYVTVDLETTGLDPLRERIIEIGAFRVTGGEITESFRTLIDPGRPIPSFITGLTGISTDMVQGAPKIETVLPRFLEFAGDSLILGHNVTFDMGFLNANCLRLLGRPFDNPFTDTMRLSRRLFPEERHHRLLDLVIRFGIADSEEHRAYADALQTHACYGYMKDYMASRGIRPETLQRAARGSGSHPRPKDILPAPGTSPDPNSPVFEKTFAFTGTLRRFTRREAMQRVRDLGGRLTERIGRETDYLVVGNADPEDAPGGKRRKADALIAEGAGLRLVDEAAFLEMLGP